MPHPYQSQTTATWTRIDMLLALYREAESSLRSTINSLHTGDDVQSTCEQVRGIKLLLALIDGIRPETDDVARNIHRLCLFVLDQVSMGTLDSFENGLRVLVTLKESFEAIADEARQLESSGEIPPLPTCDVVANVVG